MVESRLLTFDPLALDNDPFFFLARIEKAREAIRMEKWDSASGNSHSPLTGPQQLLTEEMEACKGEIT